MTIVIHAENGEVSEYFGVNSLASIGYYEVDLPVPAGDYGDDEGNVGKLLAVRHEDGAYYGDEVDVAEID